MQHPYLALQSEYLELLSKLDITRPQEAMERAKEILSLKPRYQEVSSKTGVPIVVIMALNERESSSSMSTFLGNGQRLSRVTTLVPRGRGPFSTWESGAEDALHLEHLNIITDWSWSRACYECESWNGFGPRNHNIHSGYLWSGTNAYSRGKYISDGLWESDVIDSQLGTVPIMVSLIEIDKSLSLPGWPKASPWPQLKMPSAVPLGHDGGKHSTEWLQTSLNIVLKDKLDEPLLDDGSYGRRTREAVRLFQKEYNLEIDGLAGPKTISELEVVINSKV